MELPGRFEKQSRQIDGDSTCSNRGYLLCQYHYIQEAAGEKKVVKLQFLCY